MHRLMYQYDKKTKDDRERIIAVLLKVMEGTNFSDCVLILKPELQK